MHMIIICNGCDQLRRNMPLNCLFCEHSLQRGMSGIRRFVSWRRRPTQQRLEAPQKADPKKPTDEEAAKKVGQQGSSMRAFSGGVIAATCRFNLAVLHTARLTMSAAGCRCRCHWAALSH